MSPQVAAERLSQESLAARKSLREQILPDVRVHHSGRRTFVPHTAKSGQLPNRLPPQR